MADEEKKPSRRLKDIFNLKSGRNKAAAVLVAGTLAVGGLWGYQEASEGVDTYVTVSEKQEQITRVCAEVISERTEYGPHQVEIPQEELLRMQQERVAERANAEARGSGLLPEVNRDQALQERFRTIVGEHTTKEIIDSDCREEVRRVVHSKWDGSFEVSPVWLQGHFNEQANEVWNSIEPDYQYNFDFVREQPLSQYRTITDVQDTWWTKQRKNGSSNYYDY